MLIYNVLATIYLIHVALGVKLGGILLWPAVAVHLILTVLVRFAWRAADRR